MTHLTVVDSKPNYLVIIEAIAEAHKLDKSHQYGAFTMLSHIIKNTDWSQTANRALHEAWRHWARGCPYDFNVLEHLDRRQLPTTARVPEYGSRSFSNDAAI